jgi:hypothetical protein
MADEPENLTLRLLREMREEMREGFANLHTEVQDVRTEVQAVRTEMRAENAKTRTELAKVLDATMETAKAVNGHAVLLHLLEKRVDRIEQHIGLSDA